MFLNAKHCWLLSLNFFRPPFHSVQKILHLVAALLAILSRISWPNFALFITVDAKNSRHAKRGGSVAQCPPPLNTLLVMAMLSCVLQASLQVWRHRPCWLQCTVHDVDEQLFSTQRRLNRGHLLWRHYDVTRRRPTADDVRHRRIAVRRLRRCRFHLARLDIQSRISTLRVRNYCWILRHEKEEVCRDGAHLLWTLNRRGSRYVMLHQI